MLGLESGHQVGNLGAVVVSASFLEERKATGEWPACLIPILLTKGSPVSHFEVNLAHPM